MPPRRPPRGDIRPAFHFDTGVRDAPQDHDDNFWDHDDDPHEDFGDTPGHVDWSHEDEGHVDHGDTTDRLFDRLQLLIHSLEQRLVSRQQRVAQLTNDRLAAIEAEADRVIRELGDHVDELSRRLDDATSDDGPPQPRPPRDPRG